MWRAGQKIGDYELVAQLREGGMATLFLAKRTGVAGFSRHVAIKIVHPALAADEQFRQMFLDEALLSSRIQHPNIVHVEELGEHEGTHFLAMEFVHGCSLSQLQRELLGRGRRLSPAFAVRIAMHVADALHAAHETRDENGRQLEVVHRDVTPENVLLAYAGHVKLIDFGIAKAYGRRHRTADGLLKGKFRYMAPEQAHAKALDRRVDIYQLGIVLWEMLTLRRLFDAERDVELLQSVQSPRIVAPSRLVDRIPPALDAAVMAALAIDPRRRPPDAQTFARLLAKAVPAAHEVDSGALRALLLAAMREQRQHDRGTFPRGLYDRLDQQLDTQPLAGARNDAELLPRVWEHHTIEHTAPLGSDVVPDDRPTRTLSPMQVQAPLGARPRRVRRQANRFRDWRTTLTRVVRESFVGSRAFFLAIGSCIGLVGALTLIIIAMRSAPRTRSSPARLPQVAKHVQREPAPRPVLERAASDEPALNGEASETRAAPSLNGEEAEPNARPVNSEERAATSSAGAGSDSAQVRSSPRAPSVSERARSASERKLSASSHDTTSHNEADAIGPKSARREPRTNDLIIVDGVPLATDPGF